MNSIRCCDYRELLAGITSGSASLVLTDPPYGMGYQNHFTKKKHAVLAGDDAIFSYATLASEAYRILRQNSAAFVFTRWSEYPMHFSEMRGAGFGMKEPLICQKRPSGTSDLHGSFQTNADWLLFGHKGRFTFRKTALLKNKRAGTVPNPGRKRVPDFKTRFPSCWFGEEFPCSSENPTNPYAKKHPTVKTREFLEWVILMTTDPGDLVVDPFCGSGSLVAAAEATGRRYVAGDISPEFVALSKTRQSA